RRYAGRREPARRSGRNIVASHDRERRELRSLRAGRHGEQTRCASHGRCRQCAGVLGGGAISADRPRLVVTPASPTAGAEATISLLGVPASPVVIRLLSPRQSSLRLRLRIVGQKVSRVRYTFSLPGAWTLAFKDATRRVR